MKHQIGLILLSAALFGCSDNPANSTADILSSSGIQHSSSSTHNVSSNSLSSGELNSSSGTSSQTNSSSSISASTFIDIRDGQEYSIVTIGTQTWMGENLNYNPPNKYSWCYDNLESNCDTFGRLYPLYKYADSLFATDSMLCPSGWSLPDSSDWVTLGQNNSAASLTSTTEWITAGSNSTGMNLLPGGYTFVNGYADGVRTGLIPFLTFGDKGYVGVWYPGWVLYKGLNVENVMGLVSYVGDIAGDDRLGGFSVRCMKK